VYKLYVDGLCWGGSGSVFDHRSLNRRGHIWRLFHLWLRFITFGGRSAHLAYHVHKSGRKTSMINILKSILQFTLCRLGTTPLVLTRRTFIIKDALQKSAKLKIKQIDGSENWLRFVKLSRIRYDTVNVRLCGQERGTFLLKVMLCRRS